MSATAKRVRRRRLRWNADLGPWGNGFDHGWRDAHRGVSFGGTLSVRAPVGKDTAEEEDYRRAYLEAQGVVDGGPQVRKLEGGTS